MIIILGLFLKLYFKVDFCVYVSCFLFLCSKSWQTWDEKVKQRKGLVFFKLHVMDSNFDQLNPTKTLSKIFQLDLQTHCVCHEIPSPAIYIYISIWATHNQRYLQYFLVACSRIWFLNQDSRTLMPKLLPQFIKSIDLYKDMEKKLESLNKINK